MIRAARSFWRARWNFARLLLAAFLVWTLAAGAGPRLARLQLASIPDADLLAEARELQSRGHFAEALVVCDAGIDQQTAQSAKLITERAEIAREQQSLMRRIKDVARGAITGGGQPADAATGASEPDPSLELLLGAIATDLFVVGDIRDLIIQSARWARGQHTDPVIVALSAVGIATTLAPEVDWAPSLLKAARKMGAMTEGLASFIRRSASERKFAEIRHLADDAAEIARHSSPAGAVRLFKHINSAEDAAKVARFLGRAGPAGAHALKTTGETGVQMVRSAEALRAAGKVEEAVALERTLIKVGTKGPAGAAFLARGGARALTRVHPLVGIAKSVWKGNAEALIRRLVEAFDPHARWALPAAAAWLFIELGLLFRRCGIGIPAGERNNRLNADSSARALRSA